MCIGVPARIVSTHLGDGDAPMARVDFSGVVKEASLQYVPDARPGDWVLVHVGYAVDLLDEAVARETLALLHEMERAAAGPG